jgi:hypothetical protein
MQTLYIKTKIRSIINKIKEVGILKLICPFQSKFFTLCNVVLSLSVSGIHSYPSGYPVSAHVCFLVFPVCHSLSLHTHTHTHMYVRVCVSQNLMNQESYNL